VGKPNAGRLGGDTRRIASNESECEGAERRDAGPAHQLEIQDAIPVAPGDRLDINCLHDDGSGVDSAAATLVVLPVG
jgi:hypothetical protein